MSAPFRFFPTGALILLAVMAVISAVVLVVQWREAKHAPFFLLRYEAAKRARRLLFLMILLAIGIGVMGWRTLQEMTRPMEAPGRPAASPTPAITPGRGAGIQLSPTPTHTRTPSPTPTPQKTPTFTPRPFTPRPGASFTFITFARGITESKEPLMPGSVFPLPVEQPVYAFFRFAEMENGIPWRAVWRKGTVELAVDELEWQWGRYGTAYVYFLPPGGFDAGTYSLQLHINDNLQFEASFEVQ